MLLLLLLSVLLLLLLLLLLMMLLLLNRRERWPHYHSDREGASRSPPHSIHHPILQASRGKMPQVVSLLVVWQLKLGKEELCILDVFANTCPCVYSSHNSLCEGSSEVLFRNDFGQMRRFFFVLVPKFATQMIAWALSLVAVQACLPHH